ncbi:SGNH/GDSL hydrolase family protein [Paenibacillus marinisediminis]
MSRVQFVKPGLFSPLQAAADFRRLEFDIKNECLLTEQTPVDFVFIGDSITHLWEFDPYFHSERGALINRGIGGDVAQYVAKRFEADTLQLKPNHIVLMIGVNDTFKMESTNVPNRIGWTSDEVFELVTTHIDEIAKMCADREQSLILCSILPTNRPATEANQERNAVIVQINQHIKSVAEQYGFVYVDYHRHFVDTDGQTLRDGLTDDGVHPHALGYRLMAQVLRSTLKEANIDI